MARGSSKVTIAAEGRDMGKVFLITEMPASQGEWWAIRTILALIKGGAELPEGFEKLGMAGMAQLGFKSLANLEPSIAAPLLQEMLDCVKIVPDPKNPSVIRMLIEEDIEEITTRFTLRFEVFKLHAGFLKAAVNLVSAT